MSRRLALPIGLALVAALATACGQATATRAGWLRAADAICARYGPKVAALPAPGPGIDGIDGHLRASLALTRPELDEVAALPVPVGASGDAIRAAVAARRKALDAIIAAEAAARVGVDPMPALRRAAPLGEAARRAAVAAGLRVCGARAPDPRSTA
jgi:hypothetical protein